MTPSDLLLWKSTRYPLLLIALALLLLSPGNLARTAAAQAPITDPAAAETTDQKARRLSVLVLQVQTQMQVYQQQLADMQRQLGELQQQIATETQHTFPAQTVSSQQPSVVANNASESSSQGPAARSLEELQERQDLQGAEIATHEMSKVESESKYPLKVSGQILFNTFINTRQVDIPANPTYALPRSGSTGFTLRQTILGLDANGPHLLGAASHADVRVDFFGNSSTAANTYSAAGLLRLRTAHASLRWSKTEAFVALDRPILAPITPSSLLAVSEPLFAWSGNLWSWNPQLGVSQTLDLRGGWRLLLQGALMDVADPQLPRNTDNPSAISLNERSRWPSAEARIALAAGNPASGPEFGVGGYFSPHTTSDGVRFDAWAGTLDARLPLGKHLQLLGSAYRGVALGGLGGGGYVDYVYPYAGNTAIVRPLSDVGGWTQLIFRPNERIEVNTGFGTDNPFAKEIRSALSYAGQTSYMGLVRNRSAVSSVIYSPNAYLRFSLEYRKLLSSYATNQTYASDLIGLGAGYRF